MKYKAIMLDVDGTLCPIGDINSAKVPSDKVIEALKKASEKIYIGVATSRPIYKARKAVEAIKGKDYSTFMGGAQIADSYTLKTVWLKTISRPSLTKIYKIAQKYKLPGFCNDGLTVPAFNFSEQVLDKKLINIFFHQIPFRLLETIEKKLAEIHDIAVIRLLGANKEFAEVDITNIKATKHQAIVRIAKLLKIETKEIIGVGDGPNDYPLLMACGLKIAMGNAVPELKAIADFVAPSVDEDGVATVIEKFILNH